METFANEIQSLKSSIKDIQSEIKSLRWVIVEYHFQIKNLNEKSQKIYQEDGPDAPDSQRKSLGVSAALKAMAIKKFESILIRLKNELKTKIDKLVVCTWYESKRSDIKEMKNNKEFYHWQTKEEDFNEFDVEWEKVTETLGDAEAEESLKRESIYRNKRVELSQLKNKHYESPYGSIMEKELEVLSKYKDYFIDVKDWQSLYDLMNKKFLVDVNHLIENDNWEKIGL